MKRRSDAQDLWTDRDIADADRFERDLFGLPPLGARASSPPVPARRRGRSRPRVLAAVPVSEGAALFDAREEVERAGAGWRLIGGPGSRPAEPLAAGDVYVRRALGEGRLAYVAELVSGQLFTPEELRERGLEAEGGRLGWYAQVRSAGSAESVPRRVLDPTGRLPRDSAVFRTQRGAPAEAFVETGPRTFAAARFRGNADLDRILNNTRELRKVSPEMTGADIRIVQQALVDLGYTLPTRGVDGIYGSETETAVKKFQTEQRRVNPAFRLDGIVGDQTLGRLDEIFAVLDRPCGAPTAAPVDPTAATIAQPGLLDYDLGTRTINGEVLDVRGTIYYPADAAASMANFSSAITGRAPIVFIAHGNHDTFHDPADRTIERSTQFPGWIRIRSHEGYPFLQETLAQLGIISVSVDCHSTNGPGNATPTNIRLRSGLIEEAIKHLISLDAAGSGSRLEGCIDFTRTGLLGHSRGGEAVLVVPSEIAASIAAGEAHFTGVTIASVMSLAPTDFSTLAAMPTGFPYMVILPAADGDVRTNAGARFYDRFTPGPFKSQLYVHRTNHNRFNREWVNDDYPDTVAAPLLSRPGHERLLTVYAAAFFRHTLTAVDFLDILLGRTQVAGVSNDDIHISAERSTFLTVDNHEDVPVLPATRTTTNTLGGATTLSAATVTAIEIPFSQPGTAPDNTFYGATRGMVAQDSVTYGSYRSALLAATNLTNREVWVRACEVFNTPGIPADATQFQVGVEDATGQIAFVPSGLLPRPFDRTAVDTRTKSMLVTRRFSHTCFALARPGVDLTQIRAIVLRFNGVASRKVAFDQLQLT